MGLTWAQPRCWPWPRWRLPYLIAVAVISGLLLWFAQPALRLSILISTYGVLAHARVALGRSGGRMVLIALVIGMVPVLWWTNGATLLQCGIWVIGVFLVQTFTELGMRERAARQYAEGLAADLRAMQQQLRHYAVHAEETATLRERERVAREMHDTLAQGLSASLMHIETGITLLPVGSTEARQQFNRARELAHGTLTETRVTILEMRSEALEDQSLVQALRTLAARSATDQRQITVAVHIDEEDARLTGSIALASYRIAQEALTNAIKHSHAHTIAIELSIEHGCLHLTVTDDGVGFDPQQLRAPQPDSGFGCIGMRERARLLQGQLDIISAPYMGTQVVASLPVPLLSEEHSYATNSSLAG